MAQFAQNPVQLMESYDASYGAAPSGLRGKDPFVLKRGYRSRLNIVPVLMTLFVPWVMFTYLLLIVSLPVHYDKPLFVGFCVISCLAVTGAIGVQVIKTFVVKALHPERHEPSWMLVFFVLMLVAVLAGVSCGKAIYTATFLPYLDTKALGVYSGVDPSQTSSVQLMDAGVINFANGTGLDTNKAMSFFNNMQTYCVAPIVQQNATVQSYDFWAVGVGCCEQGEYGHDAFHCAHHVSSNRPLSAYRDMSKENRALFRLAVQQAEARFGIYSAHPLFLQWSNDAMEQLEEYKRTGVSWICFCAIGHFGFNMFMTTTAAILFTKLGHE